MCGLFGHATTGNVKNLAGAFLVLALENQSRGRDSWGVSNGKETIKSLGSIERQWYKIPMKNKGLLMGHTRQATVGEKTVENSHPFEFKAKHHVIGAHNGYVSNYKELNDKYERKLEVDSAHIFAHLAAGRTLDDIEGGGAIVFFKNGGLYFSRFNGGNLAVGQLLADDGTTPIGLAWSSLECDLKKALDGSGILYETYDIKEGLIYHWFNDSLGVLKNQTIGIKTYNSSTSRIRVTDHRRNFRSSSTGSGVTDKRIVRLRVVRDVSPEPQRPSIVEATHASEAAVAAAAPEPDQQLEEIKKKIYNNTLILIDSGKVAFCKGKMCGQSTTLRTLEAEPCCLTCMAKRIQNGEVIITDQKVEA